MSAEALLPLRRAIGWASLIGLGVALVVWIPGAILPMDAYGSWPPWFVVIYQYLNSAVMAVAGVLLAAWLALAIALRSVRRGEDALPPDPEFLDGRDDASFDGDDPDAVDDARSASDDLADDDPSDPTWTDDGTEANTDDDWAENDGERNDETHDPAWSGEEIDPNDDPEAGHAPGRR
jgi:hypothetical protein